MRTHVLTKAGKRPGNKAQAAPRDDYQPRAATQRPDLFPAFPTHWTMRSTLARRQPL